MMRKRLIVTGLDIGSSKTAAVMAGRSRSGAFEILGHVSVQSKGISRGAFTDMGEATDSVQKALSKLREKTAVKPENIYVNIGGSDLKGARSTGMIPISLRGREVTRRDMERAGMVAGTVHLPFDREIVHRVLRSFSVDDQPWVRNPAGLYASRLACEAFVITADANHMQNLYKCLNGAGHDIKEIVYTGIADGKSLLDDKQLEEGTLLIDMGDSLTALSVFAGGCISDLEVLPIGSGDVAGDFRCNKEFDAVAARIVSRSQEFVRSGGRISSAVLTGGMAFAEGLIEYLEEKAGYPMKMGVAKEIRGDISAVDSLRLSTAIGLARYGFEKASAETVSARSAAHRLSEKIVDIFNNYF